MRETSKDTLRFILFLLLGLVFSNDYKGLNLKLFSIVE